jgi:hypothetical protein
MSTFRQLHTSPTKVPSLCTSFITVDYSKEAAMKELKRDMKQWLSAPDPSNTHNRLQEEHHEGTGTWFFGAKAFETWRDEPGSMLWIRGIRKYSISYSQFSILTHGLLTGRSRQRKERLLVSD